MKLVSLEIENFRQFYGKTPLIKFASGEENITVFHGSNGSGKTALLNAFTWLLFESHTKGFTQEETLVNHRAAQEAQIGGSVVVSVALTFEHSGRTHFAQRKLELTKPKEDLPQSSWKKDGGELQVSVTNDSGAAKLQDNPLDIIGRILPKQLHNYFFFDGERIEAIVQPNATERKNLGDATKSLLRLEAMVRAENRLGNQVKNTFRERLAAVSGSDIQEITRKEREQEKIVENAEQRIQLCESEIDSYKVNITEIEKTLRDGKQTRELQEQRDGLAKDAKEQDDFVKEAEDDLRRLITKDAYSIFLKPLMMKIEDKTSELRQRGELPSGIKRDFVDRLLEEKSCICGRELVPESEPSNLVANWRARSGLQAVEEKVLMLSAGVPHIAEKAEHLPRRFTTTLAKIEKCDKRRESINSKLQHVSEQIKDTTVLESAQGLESKRQSFTEKIITHEREKISNEHNIQVAKEELKKLEQQKAKVEKLNKAQITAQKRLDACIKSVGVLSSIRETYERLFRRKLRERLVQNFSKLSSTPYTPVLSDDYSLHLVNNTGGEEIYVAASQGENQVLGLTFISSIISLARDLLDKPSTQEIVGSSSPSTYPLVMDSPFGALDPAYRENVAILIPQLTDQVVVMVSSTQWKGQVESAMKSRVGRHYVFCYHTTRDGAKGYEIELDGRSYPVVKGSSDVHEYTEILTTYEDASL